MREPVFLAQAGFVDFNAHKASFIFYPCIHGNTQKDIPCLYSVFRGPALRPAANIDAVCISALTVQTL
jgi:hypothetical protein